MTISPALAGGAPARGLAYWPTPADVADDVVMLGLCPGLGDGAASADGAVPQVRVLEPSAGTGHIARAIRARLPRAHIVGIEPDPERVAQLRAAAGLLDETVHGTLEDYLAAIPSAVTAGTWQPFNLVVMNPPFALYRQPEAWADHLLAIYHDPHLLAPYAMVAAVVPHIVMTGQSRRVRAVRVLLGPHGGVYPCERGVFTPSGAAVSTVLVWIEKQPPPA